MIKIKIPNNNTNERKYIIDILFNEFLGLSYNIEIEEIVKNYEIILPNDKILTIKDTFFNKFPKDLEYLKLENIPNKIEELDIFASSFFMISRWEEYVNKNRDSHNRFPATESLAYKQGFLDRPIVNEYVEELKEMLFDLDSNLVFKERKFELVLTHDVDKPLKYTGVYSIIYAVGVELIKNKDIGESIKVFIEYFLTKFRLKKDPYDTFDYLMSLSEKLEVKSHFFFMAKGLTSYDNFYNTKDKFINKLIEKIKTRGHNVGIHPTYNAYNNTTQFRKEKEELEKNLDTNITFGREHYLRFSVPNTWQIWEDYGMRWDSTLSFADKEGFRCGVCYEYSVFNILTRKKLNLKEKPLIVMEGNFTIYQKDIKPIDMKDKIKKLINEVKKYDGEFVFLWHNSSFNTKEWEEYKYIYEEVLK
jgi:hypothetical protein